MNKGYQPILRCHDCKNETSCENKGNVCEKFLLKRNPPKTGSNAVAPEKSGEWIESERACVITCSKCGERLELCYPDGTEVRRLPYCPYCGTKMS